MPRYPPGAMRHARGMAQDAWLGLEGTVTPLVGWQYRQPASTLSRTAPP